MEATSVKPKWLMDAESQTEKQKSELASLSALWGEFPCLKKYVGRWGRVVYCSPTANASATNFEARHSCGCCSDSAFQIWPFIETSHGRVYSDPPFFTVGEKHGCGNRPDDGWDARMREQRIPEHIIRRVENLFTTEDE